MADERPSCEHELNRQLKLLKSRIDQTDQNVQSIYATNCALVQAMLDDPYTASGVGPIAGAIYGAGEAGWFLMVELWNALSIPSITELTLMLAIELASKAVNELIALVEQMLAQALAVVNQVLNQIASVIQMIAVLEQQLIDAVGKVRDQIVRQIKSLTAILNALKNILASKIDAQVLVKNFLDSHVNIASCKTTSLRIG